MKQISRVLCHFDIKIPIGIQCRHVEDGSSQKFINTDLEWVYICSYSFKYARILDMGPLFFADNFFLYQIGLQMN